MKHLIILLAAGFVGSVAFAGERDSEVSDAGREYVQVTVEICYEPDKGGDINTECYTVEKRRNFNLNGAGNMNTDADRDR